MASNFNSGGFPTISESISHSKTNPLCLSSFGEINLFRGIASRTGYEFKKIEEYLVQFSSKQVVKQAQQFQAKMISYEAYGTVDLWFLILWVNRLRSEMQLKEGTEIIVPNMRAVNRVLKLSAGRSKGLKDARILKDSQIVVVPE